LNRTRLRQAQDLLRKTDPRTFEASWRNVGDLLEHDPKSLNQKVIFTHWVL
jgi:hypothetical protein